MNVVFLVDVRVVQLVQRGVDVTAFHISLWSGEGIGWECLLEKGE